MRRRDLVFLVPVGAALGFLAWFGVRTYNLRFRSRPKPEGPRWKPGPKVLVAHLFELPAPWSVKAFLYPLPQGELKSILLRTPLPVQGGVSVQGVHLVAFSRICTHQGCTVNFVPDPEAGSILYNYRSETPFLGCPCHFGAYDPLRAGEAVYGPPRYPLPRIRLEVFGEEVYATGHEVPLRPLEAS